MTRINDLQAPCLKPYTIKNEKQLLHYYEPEPGLLIAESPKVISRALNAGYEPLSLLIETAGLTAAYHSGVGSNGNATSSGMDGSTAAIHATVSAGETAALLERMEALKLQIPVYAASPEVLRHLTGFQLTRGALCAMRRKPLPPARELLTGQKSASAPSGIAASCSCDADAPAVSRNMSISRIAILENVVNPTNVGAIFRSAAAMGMDAVLLTEGCSNPLYRRAARVSMGTVFQIPWTFIPDWPHPAMERLRELGFQTASMALSHDTVSIDDPALRKAKKLAVILGTEGDGLSQATIVASDYTIRIPMTPGIDSLNVAAASAVAFWELGNLKR
ncbi:MAG: TrmH family RNA methyltransferase [Chordicoccus sp.]